MAWEKLNRKRGGRGGWFDKYVSGDLPVSFSLPIPMAAITFQSHLFGEGPTAIAFAASRNLFGVSQGKSGVSEWDLTEYLAQLSDAARGRLSREELAFRSHQWLDLLSILHDQSEALRCYQAGLNDLPLPDPKGAWAEDLLAGFHASVVPYLAEADGESLSRLTLTTLEAGDFQWEQRDSRKPGKLVADAYERFLLGLTTASRKSREYIPLAHRAAFISLLTEPSHTVLCVPRFRGELLGEPTPGMVRLAINEVVRARGVAGGLRFFIQDSRQAAIRSFRGAMLRSNYAIREENRDLPAKASPRHKGDVSQLVEALESAVAWSSDEDGADNFDELSPLERYWAEYLGPVTIYGMQTRLYSAMSHDAGRHHRARGEEDSQ